MSKIPEAYYVYKNLLKKAEEEKKELRREYEKKIASLENEMSFLKEQIEAQHTMIEQSIEHVMKLEKQVKSVGNNLSSNNHQEKI